MAKSAAKTNGKPAGGVGDHPASFEVVSLDTLHPDVSNVRVHPDDNRAALESSLHQFGPARSIVVDGNGIIRAGNGTVEAAHRAGITEVLIVDPKPGQMVAVRRKDWTPTQAVAYGVADNKIATMAEWDETGLAATLRALQSEDFDLSATGYEAGELDALVERLADEVAGLNEPSVEPPVAKPNPRHLPIDLIFTIGGADGSCCLACHAGLRYGLRSSDYELCPYVERFADGRHKVCFVDNEWQEYNHEVHLAAVRDLRPKYCTTRDVMTRSQCDESGAIFYELAQVLDMAAELEGLAENVIVIPKYDCLDCIPERYILGYSIPTSHGGTPLPPEAFRGRRVHLLGGSWKKQLNYLALLGDDVVSVDNNLVFKQACHFGRFVRPDGAEGEVNELVGSTPTNPRFIALAITFGSMGEAINEMCGRAVATPG